MASTIKDVAKKTGLSIGTISKYLNGIRVKPKNEQMIRDAIDELDYSVNGIARGLKTKKTMTIGVLIPNLTDIFCTTIISYVEKCLAEKGYSIIVCDYFLDRNLFVEKIDLLTSKNVDGLITVPDEYARETLRKLQQKMPVVLVDCLVGGLACDAVLTDSYESSFNATSWLLEQGHRNIGIILGRRDSFTSYERLRGYSDAHERHHVPVKNALIEYGDYTVNGGFEATCRLVKNNPDMTVLFPTNVYMTNGTIFALRQLGVRIPEDISLMGFDQSDVAEFFRPRLNYLKQPLEELGERVTKLLLKRLSEDWEQFSQIIQLSTTFEQGESVKNLLAAEDERSGRKCGSL